MCVHDKFAKELKPKERVLADAFMDLAARVCTNLSFREATDILNRFLFRKDSDAIRLRTLSNSMLRMGKEISWELMTATEKVLLMYGFDPDTGKPNEGKPLSERITTPQGAEGPANHEESIQAVINNINAGRDEKIPVLAKDMKIEATPDTCVYISIDDIGVKRQKDERGTDKERSSRYVENTVAHIQHGKESYSLTTIGMGNLFKAVLAFLLANDLLQNEIVFFTDGARNIRNYISDIFAFHPYEQILDWFHLKKKCMELLSMAISGKEKRNATLEKLLRFLWVGDVCSAKDYLRALPRSAIKNQKWLDDTISYLERKEDCIPCYAVRAKLGLRISSNPVEKANDILVAQRQKHNGMSWSPKGSGALASIEMIYKNSQEVLWFKKRQLLGFGLLYPQGEHCA